MKIFSKELIIPDINKNAEKLSSNEKENIENRNRIAFDKVISKRKEMEKQKNNERLPDTVYVNLKEFNSQNNEAKYYGFNHQTKEFTIRTYFDSDPILQDETLLEQYFEAQPMKFELNKGYYSSGNIKIKRLMFSNIILKQYEYDENGNLIKGYNLSDNYKLSLKGVLKILEKNDVRINFRIDRLSRSPSTYLSCWSTNRGKIWHLEQYEEGKEYIVFDDTGEISGQKRYCKEKGSFVVLSKSTYEMRYEDKTIDEAEKETGLKLFVFDHNY